MRESIGHGLTPRNPQIATDGLQAEQALAQFQAGFEDVLPWEHIDS